MYTPLVSTLRHIVCFKDIMQVMCCMLITVCSPLPASLCRAMYKRMKVSHVRAWSYLLPDFTSKAVSCYINALATRNKPEDQIV